jgi:hypothetical protein
MADYSNETTPPVSAAAEAEALRQQRRIVITVVIAGLVFLTLIILAIIYLLKPGTPTETIRDIFIIFVALESLVIGAALIILIIQIASLINLLQNEVRPILSATNETVNTLRGTTEFLSENMVEPVIKLNSYLAGLQKLFEMVGLKKK